MAVIISAMIYFFKKKKWIIFRGNKALPKDN